VISQGFHASVVANRFLRCSGSPESIDTLLRREGIGLTRRLGAKLQHTGANHGCLLRGSPQLAQNRRTDSRIGVLSENVVRVKADVAGRCRRRLEQLSQC
jgi:hypothetical protein